MRVYTMFDGAIKDDLLVNTMFDQHIDLSIGYIRTCVCRDIIPDHANVFSGDKMPGHANVSIVYIMPVHDNVSVEDPMPNHLWQCM